MHKAIFATIVAGLVSTAPAQASEATYCSAMSKTIEAVAVGRDRGQPMIEFQMAAATTPGPAEAKAEMLGVIAVVYTDENLKRLTPKEIAGLVLISCLDVRRGQNR